MTQRRQGESSPAGARSAALALGVFVALAVVALASRGTPGDRTGAAFEVHGNDSLVGVAFLVTSIAALVLFVWVLWPSGPARPRRRRPSARRQYAIAIALVALAMFLGVRRPNVDGPNERPPAPVTRIGGGPTGDGNTPPTVGRASPIVSLGLVGGAFALLVGLGVVARLADARAAAADTDEDEEADGAVAGLDPVLVVRARGGMAAVESERDPRTAILLAYGALAHHLADGPFASRRTATPQEWLAATAGAPAPVHTGHVTLTALYERARFSAHEPTEADRASAIAALAAAVDASTPAVQP